MDNVAGDLARLTVIEHGDRTCSADAIIAALKTDNVVLVRNTPSEHSESIIVGVAERLGLLERLELQAGFAALHGHRKSVGAHFMSVNDRDDYQFVIPHSEGHQVADIRLAAFYCHENTTDGGVTIVQNTDSGSKAWDVLREVRTKADLCGRTLAPRDIAKIKTFYGVVLPQDVLQPDDEIISDRDPIVPGVKFFRVLAKPRETSCRILGRSVRTYWDTIATPDIDSGREFTRLMRAMGLLRLPTPHEDDDKLDAAHPKKLWRSGVNHDELFKSRIAVKLSPGDLLLQNNLTWTHSCTNWTPNSGVRSVVAAFA